MNRHDDVGACFGAVVVPVESVMGIVQVTAVTRVGKSEKYYSVDYKQLCEMREEFRSYQPPNEDILEATASQKQHQPSYTAANLGSSESGQNRAVSVPVEVVDVPVGAVPSDSISKTALVVLNRGPGQRKVTQLASLTG